MLVQTIYKLGTNVKRSARWFIGGLILGIVAAGLITLGYYRQHHYQILGLALLLPAVLAMGYGYVGIFANRIAQVIDQIQQRRERNKRLYEDQDDRG